MKNKDFKSKKDTKNIGRRSNKRKNSDSLKKRKLFFIVIVCVISILMIFGLVKIFSGNSKVKDDNLIYNRNKTFIKQQKIDGIAFKDINCTYDGKNSLITYTIINETGKDIYLSNYDIIVRDKNKQIITKIVASYSENIPPKKKISMANSIIGVDLSDAYYMELKLKTGNK